MLFVLNYKKQNLLLLTIIAYKIISNNKPWKYTTISYRLFSQQYKNIYIYKCICEFQIRIKSQKFEIIL